LSTIEERKKVLDLLVEHEEAIGLLYRAYARRFPERAAFWTKLAAEETEHARWIRTLEAKVEAGGVSFDRGRFSVEAIESSLEYVRREAERAEEEELPAVSALSIASDLEHGLIEKRFFEVFEGDSGELRTVLRDLAAGTFQHRDAIQEAWEKARAARGEESHE
jgi:hypothetical protein